jgi:hypothetical protein
MIMHSTVDHTDPTENAFFANSIAFSNHRPIYYFQYLKAKERDYQLVTLDIENGRLPASEIPATLNATLCPLIRLEHLRELMCSVPDEYVIAHQSTCAKLSKPETP